MVAFRKQLVVDNLPWVAVVLKGAYVSGLSCGGLRCMSLLYDQTNCESILSCQTLWRGYVPFNDGMPKKFGFFSDFSCISKTFLNATLMLSYVARPGDWIRLLNRVSGVFFVSKATMFFFECNGHWIKQVILKSECCKKTSFFQPLNGAMS